MIEYEFYPQHTDNIKRVYGTAEVLSYEPAWEGNETLEYELISPTIVFEDDISVELDEEDVENLLDQQDMDALTHLVLQAHLNDE